MRCSCLSLCPCIHVSSKRGSYATSTQIGSVLANHILIAKHILLNFDLIQLRLVPVGTLHSALSILAPQLGTQKRRR